MYPRNKARFRTAFIAENAITDALSVYHFHSRCIATGPHSHAQSVFTERAPPGLEDEAVQYSDRGNRELEVQSRLWMRGEHQGSLLTVAKADLITVSHSSILAVAAKLR